jgi:hypothetical protein
MNMISMASRPDRVRFVVAIGLACTGSPALADDLQQQVLAGARTVADTDFAFTQTFTGQRTGEPAKEYVMRYDPKRGAGSRWTLVRAEGRAPTPKETANFAKQANKSPVPSYGRVATWFGAPAKRVATGNGSVTYRFSSLPKGTIKIGSHDASATTSAEAIVNTSGKMPFVERIRYTSTKPFRMMLVAKIDRMTTTVTYRMMPNNRPMITGSNTDMAGSAMSKSGSFKMLATYSDIRAAR